MGAYICTSGLLVDKWGRITAYTYFAGSSAIAHSVAMVPKTSIGGMSMVRLPLFLLSKSIKSAIMESVAMYANASIYSASTGTHGLGVVSAQELCVGR